IALGGGSLQNQQVLDHLKSTGLLIFIEAPLSLIIERISDDEGRPMLLDEHGKPKEHEQLYEDIELLYESRLPLYSQADIIFKVAPGETAEQQAETLISKSLIMPHNIALSYEHSSAYPIIVGQQ